MENICEKFAKKENKSIITFQFLYEGNIVNFKLSFKEQINSKNLNNNEINIIVFKIPKLKEKIDAIIISNIKIKDDINKFKLKIKRIIMINLYKSINNHLKNIEGILNIIIENIETNIKKLKDLLYNDNDKISNINFNNINIKKGRLNKYKIKNKEDLNNKNLLGNIKSKLILNKIFFHFKDKIKLKLVKFNKNNQNIININLINYKIFSDR